MSYPITRARVLPSMFLIAFVLFMTTLTGCSDDEQNGVGPGNGGSATLQIESLIFNPKSPAPGDTLLATVVVSTGSTVPGDFATFSWSADGGDFVEKDKSTVRWVAPATSTMFTISVQAQNSSSSASASDNIFVSEINPVISEGAGELHLNPAGDVLFYVGSPVHPTDEDFFGFGIRRYDLGSGADVELFPPVFSFQHGFSNDVTMVAWTMFTGGPGRFQVAYLDLNSLTFKQIPTREASQRAPQHTEPYFSPDKTLLTYQSFLPDFNLPPNQGGVDTFVVDVWDIAADTLQRVAVQARNFHPTFSSDGGHLVYISDRSATQEWELWALPVVGGTITVDSLSTPLQLTSTGGLMGTEGSFPDNEPKAWNPDPSDPILATTDNTNKLWLVWPDGVTPAVQVNVAGNASEFIWTPDGQELIMTTGSSIFRVSKAGTATLIHSVPGGDAVTRLSLSSSNNGDYLLYSVKRLVDEWYELIDLGGSLGITAPLRVTPSGGVGNAGPYAGFMSLKPVWLPSAPIAYLLFFNAGPTPRVSTMDFGGLTP